MRLDPTLLGRPLDLDFAGEPFRGTVAELVQRLAPATPSDGALLRAARRDLDQTPGMLEEKARWIEIEDRLRAGGLGDREIAQAMVAGVGEAFGFPVDDEVIGGLLREVGDPALAAEVAEHALAEDALPGAGFGALWVLAKAGRLDERFDALLTLDATGRTLRAVLAAMTPARRARALERLVPEEADPRFADVQLGKLLWVLDLVEASAVRARIAALADALRPNPDGDEELAALVARCDRGEATPAPPVDADGLTPAARAAFEDLAAAGRAAHARGRLGEVARAAHDRKVRVLAPELASAETWRAAGVAQREAAARAVATRTKGTLAYVGVRTYGDLPIPVLRHPPSGTLFSLVPGGSFRRGLSEAEEALLRARAAGPGREAREAAALLDRIAEMRPALEVHVGPLVVAQEPALGGDAALMASFLEDEPFRLLSEAEWERLARGDRRDELTPFGHRLPDEALLAELIAAGAERPNAFGLWGIGLQPELCADAFHASYEGAPADGTPRWGEGPRVVRGGAAEHAPWQGAGEWHLLCCAARGRQDRWETLAARPALGVEIG